MAFWQKKLLRYALSRSGLLDDKEIDLTNLDLQLGRRNTLELRDVGLNISRISKLAQLPPSLRIESARVLSLKLMVPADIYQSSIVVEVDGVQLGLKLVERYDTDVKKEESRPVSPTAERTVSHRKTHRRLRSPPPYDPGGAHEGYRENVKIPTTEDIARSFLQEEHVQDRRDIEASLAANRKSLEDSITSESSQGSEVGTGNTIGLPGFLTGFLQGIVDRLDVRISNVQATLESDILDDAGEDVPVKLCFSAKQGSVGCVQRENNIYTGMRKVELSDMAFNLITRLSVMSSMSEVSPSSPLLSRASTQQSPKSEQNQQKLERPSTSSTNKSFGSATSKAYSEKTATSAGIMQASAITLDEDRFANAGEDDDTSLSLNEDGIMPGDDNISWTSRQGQQTHGGRAARRIWESVDSHDEIEASAELKQELAPDNLESQWQTEARRRSSPFSRSLNSPGSWPKIEDSQVMKPYQSPGSWPIVDSYQPGNHHPLVPYPPSSDGSHSRHSQPSPGSWPADQDEDVSSSVHLGDTIAASSQVSSSQETLPEIYGKVDNKHTALAYTDDQVSAYSSPVSSRHEDKEDLTASRVFSHEEAESMYMSAMTGGAAASTRIDMPIPGGWSSDESQDERPVSPEYEPKDDNPTTAASGSSLHFENPAAGFQPEVTTPRAQTPRTKSSNEFIEPEMVSRELLHIDTISIWIPSLPEKPRMPSAEAKATPSHERGPSASFVPDELPGAFSTYSEKSRTRRGTTSFGINLDSKKQLRSDFVEEPSTRAVTEVSVGSISGQLDIANGRLLWRLANEVIEALNINKEPQDDKTPKQVKETDDSLSTVELKSIRLAFCDKLNDLTDDAQYTKDLTSLVFENVQVESGFETAKVQIQRFGMFVGESKIIAFSRDIDTVASEIAPLNAPDISVLRNTSMSTVTGRRIDQIDIQTLPIDLNFDLPVWDEVFSTFGGLSGMLELGNSALAEGKTMSASRPGKQSKGVHFSDDTTIDPSGTEVKLNLIVNGSNIVLRGISSSVALQTSTIRAVSRQQKASATISQVQLNGPYTRHADIKPGRINLTSIRLDYAFTPSDKHIERLLAILTPSTDQYAETDDILLDALIRQRKKGSLMQVSIDGVQLEIGDKACLGALKGLGDEMGKLSAVASYLPEDDRPGLLSLVRLKQLSTQIPVNKTFGDMHIRLEELNVAHVGWPALLAVSLANLSLHEDAEGREPNKALLHNLIPVEAAEAAPVLRARMVGDEVEPSLQVKLYNICLEYRLSTFLALSEHHHLPDSQIIAVNLARSISDASHAFQESSDEPGTQSSSPLNSSTDKKTRVSLLIRDCAIGLDPEKIHSKALIVLSDARTTTLLPPPSDRFSGELELRKAGLYLADDFTFTVQDFPRARSTPRNMATSDHLTSQLSLSGFVSVGSVVSLAVKVLIQHGTPSTDQAVEVELSNELVLLESCADSTQTLFAVLGCLAPPTPPSKQEKYLTDPIPVENLMESFSGDAYAKPESEIQRETLFDIDQEQNYDQDEEHEYGEAGEFLAASFDEETEQLLLDSQLDGSLYGPIDGIIGDTDAETRMDDEDNSQTTVESFLEEEDPFEMPDINIDRPMSDDALTRDLQRQFHASADDQTVDLGDFEIPDLGYEAMSGGNANLGTKQRFSTPATVRSNKLQINNYVETPFKLRLRDFHIIWNLHDGYDWQRTRQGITQAVEEVELRMEERRARRRGSNLEPQEELSEIGDFLFNSIYIGVPGNDDAQELRRRINRGIDDLVSETESIPVSGMSRPTSHSTSARTKQGQPRRLRLERSRKHKIVFELKGLSADILVFPPGSEETQNLVDIRVGDLEVLDNVPTSTWRKFLTYNSQDRQEREMSRPMAHITIETVRTIRDYAATELLMRVEILPLRLHVDQDALDFITRFFEFKDAEVALPDTGAEPVFIQRLDIETVDLCLDYKPKTIDYGGLKSGHTTEFMNFVILDAAPIRLKRAIVHGLRGFDPLHTTLNNIWMPDVKRHQLPGILGSLAPVRHLTNIGTGVIDVIAIPVREYKKDGRIMRSVQKGAFNFGKTTTSELARLGAKVATGTHNILEGAEKLLSSNPSSSSVPYDPDADAEDETQEQRAVSAYANQPFGVFSGLRSARRYLEHDLLTARDALIAVQGEVLDSSTPGGVASAIARHGSTVILRPVIGASRAVGTALMGVGNQIDKANLKKVDDKYKRS